MSDLVLIIMVIFCIIFLLNLLVGIITAIQGTKKKPRNCDIYKTPEEAFRAQVNFCQCQSYDENNCHKNGCKYATGTTPCIVQWLYDRTEGTK